MKIENAICSVVCLQAYRLGNGDLDLHRTMIGRLIERELQRVITGGSYIFRVGMTMGADIWAAERITRLRDSYYPEIQLHCYLSRETQADHWPADWRRQYLHVLAGADEVVFLQDKYSKGCMARRSRAMMQGSGVLLAVHDNVAGGGLSRVIGHAELQGIETIVIQAREGPEVPAGYESSRLQVSSTYPAEFSRGRSAIKRAW
ncbi:MAG: DUF1273 domain-containing protein [Oscillospiraceae bacterium]|nr:DUF1273 domain-containing protein [Oscillospiraceae bacterium]